MGNVSVLLSMLAAAPLLLYVERKLTFLIAAFLVGGGLWLYAPAFGFASPDLRYLWVFLGVIAGAFAALSSKR